MGEHLSPEVREYRACFSDKDVPTNLWSDILPVTVTPQAGAGNRLQPAYHVWQAGR